MSSRFLKWGLFSVGILTIISLLGWFYWQGYIFDGKPPDVLITHPSKNKEFILSPIKPKAREVIQIKVSDNKSVDKVILFLNNSQLKVFERNDKLSFNWETDSKGRYTFKAIAYDRAKNKGESKPVTITVKVKGILPQNYTGFQKPIETYVSASGVFLREGPSVNYRVIRTLKHKERVLVFGKWSSTSPNEAITTDRVTLVTFDGESIGLDRGKALLIVKKEEPYYIVSVQIDNRKVTGKLPVYAVKDIFNKPWYYIRTKEGKEGWVFGEFLEGVEESLR
ncbi:MAG: hypothetical protein ACP5K2_00790 [bacterium]